VTVTITPQNLICSKQRKGIFYFSRKNCYSKPIKTGQNPQVVKHVVKPDFYGGFWKRKKP
jgi:hypothetical protein